MLTSLQPWILASSEVHLCRFKVCTKRTPICKRCCFFSWRGHREADRTPDVIMDYTNAYEQTKKHEQRTMWDEMSSKGKKHGWCLLSFKHFYIDLNQHPVNNLRSRSVHERIQDLLHLNPIWRVMYVATAVFFFGNPVPLSWSIPSSSKPPQNGIDWFCIHRFCHLPLKLPCSEGYALIIFKPKYRILNLLWCPIQSHYTIPIGSRLKPMNAQEIPLVPTIYIHPTITGNLTQVRKIPVLKIVKWW